jgi:glycosyltransferase involved in cell wall biosynthesis
MPFLEILTRTFNARPHLLRINQESLQRQTDSDWVQTLLVDDVGRGIDWASENLAAYAPHLLGEYIWILDDDDTCILPTLVAELKFIAADSSPDVIMLRMDHGAGRLLPGDDTWMGPPVLGQIGCSAFVVRREVWQRHAGAMSKGHYASDFDLINAIWKSEPTVYWHDVVASRVMRQSFGRPEAINPWQRATPSRA